MIPSKNILGMSLKSYQNFGSTSRLSIPKQWVIKIKKIHSEPIGIQLYQNSPTSITGKFVFTETDEQYYPLQWYGNHNATLNFTMPKFFKDFVSNLPINERTLKKKYKKTYCKIELINNHTTILWYIDKDILLNNYIFLDILQKNYKKTMIEKIEMALSMIKHIETLKEDKLKKYNFKKLNNIFNELKYRNEKLFKLKMINFT